VSSVATLRPPAVIYREEQFFAWWVYLMLGIMAALALLFVGLPHPAAAGAVAGPHPGRLSALPAGLVVGLTLPALLVVGVLRMTTEVTPTELRVWFGWVATYRLAVPLATIQRLEVVRYRPLADCRGWGIRSGPDGERVLSARGDRGVRLTLADGSRLLIGSQQPEALARELERAMRPTG
jgi:hypothetical protein